MVATNEGVSLALTEELTRQIRDRAVEKYLVDMAWFATWYGSSVWNLCTFLFLEVPQMCYVSHATGSSNFLERTPKIHF